MNPKYNWDDIQRFYDSGKTIKEVSEKFGVSRQTCTKSRYFNTRPQEEQRAMAVATRRRNGNIGHSQTTKDKLSVIATNRGFGGRNYRKVYEYNGVLLESSYELCLAQDLDKNNIDWVRPTRVKWIDTAGKVRHYTPDFYLPKYNVYLDPKNDYLIMIDSDKIERCSIQNNMIILVLRNTELTWAVVKEKLSK